MSRKRIRWGAGIILLAGAAAVGAFLFHAHSLDRVAAAEFKSPRVYEQYTRIHPLLRYIRRERDEGQMTVEEFSAAVQETFSAIGRIPGALDAEDVNHARARGPAGAAQLEALLKLDPDMDGKLLAAELSPMLKEAFKVLDRDHDGNLSLQEQSIARNILKAETFHTACTLPRINGEKVIFIGADAGGFTSTVALGGQDNMTTVARLEIGQGLEKIYLMLAGNTNMIWQLSGDVQRVSKVILLASPPELGGKPPAGVVGVPAGRTSFIDRRTCLSGNSSALGMHAEIKDNIRWLLARDPDLTEQKNTIHTASVYGATVQFQDASRRLTPPEGFDRQAWVAFLLEENSSGIADLAKELAEGKIVSGVPGEIYQVLPGLAGIAQLMGQGAIVSNEKKFYRPESALDGSNQMAAILLNRRFWIVDDIPALPANTMREFILARGVKMPRVSGARCVISQETGLPVDPANAACPYLQFTPPAGGAGGECPYKNHPGFRQLVAQKYASYLKSREREIKDGVAVFGGTEAGDDFFVRGVNRKTTVKGLAGNDVYFMPLKKNHNIISEQPAPDEINTLVFADIPKKESPRMNFSKNDKALAIYPWLWSNNQIVINDWFTPGRRKPVSCFVFLPDYYVMSANDMDNWARSRVLDTPLYDAPPGLVKMRPAKRLFKDLPPDTALHYLGVLKAAAAVAVPPGMTGDSYGRVDVRIRTTAPILLVLSSSEPVHWVLTPFKKTNVVGILVTGYHRQTVASNLPGVPVINVSGGMTAENYFHTGSRDWQKANTGPLQDITGIVARNSYFQHDIEGTAFDVW